VLLPAAPPLLRWRRLVLGRGQPEGIETISSQLETEVVRESADTIDLYMVILPRRNRRRASRSARRCDRLGRRLPLVSSANVAGQGQAGTNWGLAVEKVAPAPPEAFARPEGRKPLTAGTSAG